MIDNILNEFISSGEPKIRLAELQSRLITTSTSPNLIELNKIMLRLKSLFAFTYIGINLAVSVDITLKVCPSYNSNGCRSGPNCRHLHVCEKQFKSTTRCRSSCRLLHSFDSAEIQKKLIEDPFDYNLLMKFYQTFYVPNASSSSSSVNDLILINNNREPRAKRFAADQLERYMYQKPLDNNVFLSMIFKSKNEMWRNDLQNLLKRERAIMEIESNALVILPVRSEMATLEPINDWFERLNRLLSEFFARFRIEKIKHEWSNHMQLEDLKQRIDQYQKLEYQETDDNMIAVIGRLDHFADFLSRHPQFNSLFA